MKGKILISVITVVITILIMLLAVFFIFGLGSKPATVMSLTSPDGMYEAYVVENPSPDPPNQSLFISKTGTDSFRLVTSLPEDIESTQKISWTEDSKTAIFVTDWYLIITDVRKFNTRVISLNPDWWQWHRNRRTFSSSGQSVRMEQFDLLGSDSLRYRTNIMTQPELIRLNDL
jgi:hypothetical protein